MFCGNRIYYVAAGGLLVFLLGAAVTLAQEVAPPVLESQTVPEKEEGADKARAGAKGEEEDARPHNLTPALNQIESAIRDFITQQRSAQEQGPAKHEIQELEAQQDTALWAKAMFVATAVATSLTAVGVFLIWRTLIHTRRAAEHAGGMLDEARKTTMAAQDATTQAEHATAVTIKSMDRTAERQLRAYVSLSPVGIDWDVRTKRPVVIVRQKNNGQTPAKLARYMARAEGLSFPLAASYEFPNEEFGADINTLRPGHEFEVGHICADILLSDLFKFFPEQNLRMYFWAAISYQDIFERQRVTRVCWSYSNSNLHNLLESLAGEYSSRQAHLTKPKQIEFDYADRYNTAD